MWLSFKNWIRRPLIITGLVCLLISAVAQKKDYWKHWNIPAAFQNLSLILKESRPLELVLTDRDPDAKHMVLRALATAPGQTVKVEESYQNPHLRFFLKGQRVEKVQATASMTPESITQTKGKYEGYFLRGGKIVFWCVGLVLSWAFFSPIPLLWMRLLGTLLGFSFLEMVRVWSPVVYSCLLVGLVVHVIIRSKNAGVIWFPEITPATGRAFCYAIPGIVLILAAVAHAELHWDAAEYWLPRGFLIALHDTLFFNSFYPPDALMPNHQGYPPLWPALLSVPFSFYPQLVFAMGPMILFLMMASVAEYLTVKKIPWPYVLSSVNFIFIYLSVHSQWGYSQDITAAVLLLFVWAMLVAHEYRGMTLILVFCGFLIPLTRMESIVYLWALLPLGLLLKVNWRILLAAGLAGIVSTLLWSWTAKTNGLSATGGLALEGARMLMTVSIWEWIHRVYFIMEYKLIRKKLNAEHYMMMVFLIGWLMTRWVPFKKLFWQWRTVWAFFLLMWGTLLFLYFPVPVMDLKEMERVYLGTGFFRMYSHFVPALFVLLPSVLFIAFKRRDV